MGWLNRDKGKPLETYTIRNTKGIAEVLVVCRKWIAEESRFGEAIRIEPLASSLYDGEGKPQ